MRESETGTKLKVIELAPIKESTEDYERIEARIKAVFRKMLYVPLMRELGLPTSTLRNSRDDLLEALRSGRLTFLDGAFRGKLNATLTRELKALGARWDRRQRLFVLDDASLPRDVWQVVGASEARFAERLASIDRKLSQNLPAEIAESVKVSDLFDSLLWKTDKEVGKTLERITVTPKLTTEQASRIAAEWQNNMDLWIQNFAEKEIVRLRKEMQGNVFAGNRFESAIKSIQRSYGVTQDKAKFLARQETSLLVTKFKETRYTDAGVNEYRWGCVVGSPKHPVRPAHKALQGEVFRWDDPPITTEPGQPVRRNNPGQDFNCRCFARPILRFK